MFGVKKIIKRIVLFFIKPLTKFINFIIREKGKYEKNELKTKLKKVGNNFSIGNDYLVLNPKYIEIGDNFTALDRFRIEAWDKYENDTFEPKIKIGNNVIFNTDIHIGCINSVEIGDNCLFASRIYITDHHHGDTSDGMIKLQPSKRPLISKGKVLIMNNVWVGEGVVIMPGVTIGENCIIAANAVVTKDVPNNAVAAGIPAKVIKGLN
ncbi:MAG TPA: DapH/DapD/GlmU-related protein [Flavobacterium sp.]|uniref:acyltransferase n=1 Tax=Flavobacterium sp. TaxID=239 RepID=UPI002D004882|nr:acyltransferase [Flavobacterium sp.]HNP32720.1 DapH/DapD/GlmU-related protein [Flavobacterium sp.]